MYSTTIKFLFALTGLSPILLTLWIVNTIQNLNKLTFYSPFGSNKIFINGTEDFLITNWELLSFILIVLFSTFIISKAVKDLPPRQINIKSIKPADINYISLLISYILPWFKFFISNDHDKMYLIGLLFVSIIMALITMNSYHYNLIVRLFLGYKNYEVQTTGEMTYLMLSKKKLINRTHITHYVLLTDHMLINVS